MAKAANAELIVMPATSRASRVAAGVAQRLGAVIDTRLTGLSAEGGKITATRWFYRQRMLGTIERDARPWLVTIDSGCFEAVSAPGSASVEMLAVAPATRTQVTGIVAPAADAQTIRPDAKLLLVAGAGWGKSQSDGQKHVDEAARLILGLLSATQASLGSSKSLVDQSGEGAALPFLTHMHQVGQTGATPRHPKGPVHLLPRRGAARGGLALHRRTPGHQPGRQLRLGPGQGRRALRGRRLCRDAEARGDSEVAPAPHPQRIRRDGTKVLSRLFCPAWPAKATEHFIRPPVLKTGTRTCPAHTIVSGACIFVALQLQPARASHTETTACVIFSIC